MSEAANQEVKKSTDFGGMFKDTGILLVITLVAGLLLGLVYQITKEPIALQPVWKFLRMRHLLQRWKLCSRMHRNGRRPDFHRRR